ncbi:hypothetical protein AB0395_40810 [Streptosporangium sp. NPDC051023]|uniref:YybH family protein n=1 Tax=Streptosporangium sp. NPDC051023 TaxID=3155410 RepID=UPI00344D71E0
MKKFSRVLPVSMAIVLDAGALVGVTDTYIASAAPAANAAVPAAAGTKQARSPEELLTLLGERIKAKDVDGIIALHEPEAAIVNYDLSVIRGHKAIKAFCIDWFKADPVLTVNPGQTVMAGGRRLWNDLVIHRTASIMGTYSLEQTGPDGKRESFTGNFCDTVQEQLDGSWLYVQDNPYPPHGGAAAAPSGGRRISPSQAAISRAADQ